MEAPFKLANARLDYSFCSEIQRGWVPLFCRIRRRGRQRAFHGFTSPERERERESDYKRCFSQEEKERELLRFHILVRGKSTLMGPSGRDGEVTFEKELSYNYSFFELGNF